MNGVLLVDKPAGLTSRQVDDRVKRGLGRGARVGHAGTLDPFATGLLPVLIGEATKLSPWLTGCEKAYEAELVLGRATDTADREGAVVAEAAIGALDPARIRAAMDALTGTFPQRVPAYSAVKQGGEALHAKARRGEAVDAPVRDVTVYAWDLLGTTPTSIRFSVRCAAGTFVRALGEQLAERLGTIGYLETLRRTAAGRFSVADARPLDEALARMSLLPLEAALDLPVVHLDARTAWQMANGQRVSAPDGPARAQAWTPEGRLLAVVERRETAEDTPPVWRVVRGFRLGSPQRPERPGAPGEAAAKAP